MLHGLWHKCSVMAIMLNDGDDGQNVGCGIMLHGPWHKCSVMPIMLDDGHDVG